MSHHLNPLKHLKEKYGIVYTPKYVRGYIKTKYGIIWTPKTKRKYVKYVRPCVNTGAKYHVNGNKKMGGFWGFGFMIIPCSECNFKRWIEFIEDRLRRQGYS